MRYSPIKFLVTFMLLAVIAPGVAEAQKRRTTTKKTTKKVVTPAEATRAVLPTILTKISNLNSEVDRVARRSNNNADTTDALSGYLLRLDESTSRLSEVLDSNDPFSDELRDMLMAATRIDQFLAKNRVSPSTQTQWRSLKRDLTTIITTNRVSWNWRQYLPALPDNTATAVNTPTPTPTPISTPTVVASPTPTPYNSTLSYTVSDAQMNTLLSRIDLKSGFYRTQLQAALKAGSNIDVSESTVTAYLSRLETAQARLRENFDRGQVSMRDLTDLLLAATYIDQFMERNRLTGEAEGQWRDLRGDLNTLANNYKQSWNWNQTLPSSTVAGTVNLRNIESRITGTYRLNPRLSEDPTEIVNRTLGAGTANIRDERRNALERRLRSPEMIAIEMSNRTVSMASSNLPKITFQADGMARSEQNERGRTVTTTSTLDTDGLTVSFSGERANDFYLTVVPEGQDRLRVTRRIFVDNNSNEEIRVTGVYDKIDTVARWASVVPPARQANNSTGFPDAPAGQTPATVDASFVVPAGTRFNAELLTPISADQADTSFTMRITSPGQFRGATLSGRAFSENANSRVAGRARVLLAFDTITLPQGRAYRFAGDINTVTTPSGDMLEVTTQAAAQAQPQQQQRGAGAILGALIGAIAGVPANQGAAATIGGSILTQRAQTFYLEAGTQVTLTTTAPVQ